MLMLTWAKNQLRRQSTGWHSLHPFHLLDLVHILFLEPKQKVQSSCSLLNSKKVPFCNAIIDFRTFFWMLKLGARSTSSSIKLLEDSDRSKFEVGYDHLKLTFSSEEGKPIQYVNHRSAVCY